MRRRSIIMVLLIAVLASGQQVLAHGERLQHAYYDDTIVSLIVPSEHSRNPHQQTLGCFNLGPAVPSTVPTIPLYGVFSDEGALHTCPDGSMAHYEVLSAVPGASGYRPHWRVILVVPLVADLAHPLTSEAAILAAADAGQVVLVETGLAINAPVVHRTD